MTAALPIRHREGIAAAAAAAARSPAAVRDDVVALTQYLYRHWYTRLVTPKPTGWHMRVPFLTRLRQALAHAARGRGVPSRALVVGRQHVDPASGYWTTWSPAGPPGAGGVQRVYWDAIQVGAPGLVHDLVATLPDRVAWSLKTPLVAEDFLRPDAVVLYLDAASWPDLRPLISSLAAAQRRALHPDVPPLTTWLADGVSTVPDPGVTGESFGLALCRCIAEVVGATPHAGDGRGVDLSAALTARLFPTRSGRAARRGRTDRSGPCTDRSRRRGHG